MSGDFKLADAFVDVEFRTDGADAAVNRAMSRQRATVSVDADATSAQRTVSEFVRDTNGRLRDAQGRFVVEAETSEAERQVSEFVRDANGRLRDARGRFIAEADVAGAQAQIAGLGQSIDRVDGRRAGFNVDADVGAAMMKIAMVTAAIGGLSAVAVAGVGAISGVGAAVGAGLGAVMLGTAGVGDAVKAMGAANDDAGASAQAASQQHRQMAQAIDGVKQARAALSNTEANAAAASRRAAEQVDSAKRQLVAAEQAAGEAAKEAARKVKDAEADYTAAIEDEKRAQDAVNDARRAARQELEDLQRQTEDMANSQESASIALARAEENLAKVNADASASDLDRREAALRLAEAQQRLKDVNADAVALAEKKAAADKAGVEGAEQVIGAERRVADAHKATGDAARQVSDAKSAQTKSAQDSAERVAAAERRVADAVQSAADQQRQSAYAIQQAQHAVAQAQEHVRDVSQQAGAQGSAAAKNLATAMAALTPVGQEFARFLRGFVDGPIQDLKNAGQNNLLPGLQKGLEAVVPMMGPITESFGAFSKTLGQSLAGIIPIVASLAKPFLDFANGALQGLKPLEGVLKTFTSQLGDVFAKLTQSGALQQAMGGFTQLVGAILPLIPALVEVGTKVMAILGPSLAGVFEALVGAIRPILGVMPQLAQSFAPVLAALSPLLPVLGNLVATLLTSLAPVLPPLALAFAKLALALVPLVPAMMPLLELFLELVPVLVAGLIPAINLLASGIAAASGWITSHSTLVKTLAVTVLTAVGAWKAWELGVAAWSAVTKIATAVQVAFTAVMNANPIMLVIVAIAALAAGLIYAYKHSDTFRQIVDNAWKTIKSTVSSVWQWMKPTIESMVEAVKKLGGWFSDLYSKHIKPAWDDSKTKIAATWQWLKPILDAVIDAVKKVGGWFLDLYSKYVKVAWESIKTIISTVWTVVKAQFEVQQTAIKTLGGVFSDLYSKYVKPAWDNIKTGISTVWQWLKPNVFDKLSSTVTGLGAVFTGAVSKVKSAWSSIASVAQRPIKWAVDNVFNRVVDIWNTIVGKIPGVDKLSGGGTIPSVPGFASGGPISGPGNGTSDDVPIMASDGEWVIRERAASQLGPRAMDAINNADRLGLKVSGDESGLAIRQKYADGGAVSKVKSWLPSLTSIPYVWGGVGPSGYDCSGITGEVWARLTGNPSYRRYMTTSSDFASMGFAKGTGMYTIGVNPGSHMAGRLDGTAFEAPHTGANLRVGSAAQSVGSFAQQWYLKDFGTGGGSGDGGGLSPLEIAKTAAKKAVDALTGGWWSKLGDMGFFGKVGLSLGKKLVGGLFDSGGMLQPGTQLVTNNTGRPEPVFTPAQWDALRGVLPGGAGRAGGSGDQYHFAPGSVVLDASKVQDMADVVSMVKQLVGTSRSYGGGR